MGFLGDLFDDVMGLPEKAVDWTLGLPADVLAAARKAGVKTQEELDRWLEGNWP